MDRKQIPLGDLKPLPLLHRPLPESLLANVRVIQETFAEVFPQTMEQWEDGFRRDVHHKREIALWLCMAQTFQHFTAGRDLSPEQRGDIFKVILTNDPQAEPPITVSRKRQKEIVDHLRKLWAVEQPKYPSPEERDRNYGEVLRRLQAGLSGEDALPEDLR